MPDSTVASLLASLCAIPSRTLLEQPIPDIVTDSDDGTVDAELHLRSGELVDLPGWTVLEWERKRMTYAGDSTKAEEAIWFSPACLAGKQRTLFNQHASGVAK